MGNPLTNGIIVTARDVYEFNNSGSLSPRNLDSQKLWVNMDWHGIISVLTYDSLAWVTYDNPASRIQETQKIRFIL